LTLSHLVLLSHQECTSHRQTLPCLARQNLTFQSSSSSLNTISVFVIGLSDGRVNTVYITLR
jgi:hypothetical protein